MRNDNKTNEEKYYEQATDWDIDQVKRTKESEKKAWIVAFSFMGIALVSCLSIVLMMPLKQLEYLVIRVDEVTGMVDVQRTTLEDAKQSYAEVTDKYWLRRYVRMREHWLYDEYESTYREVGLLSAPQEQKKWFEFFQATNPASPYNTFSNKAKVKVSIRSVVMIGKNLANVHFTKTTEINGLPQASTYWVATIPYRYVNAPESEDDREVNPIGFQVLDGYRVDPESGVTTTDARGVK